MLFLKDNPDDTLFTPYHACAARSAQIRRDLRYEFLFIYYYYLSIYLFKFYVFIYIYLYFYFFYSTRQNNIVYTEPTTSFRPDFYTTISDLLQDSTSVRAIVFISNSDKKMAHILFSSLKKEKTPSLFRFIIFSFFLSYC